MVISLNKQLMHQKIDKNNVLINLVTDNEKIINQGTTSFSFNSSLISDGFVPFKSKKKCINFSSFSASVYLNLDANENWTICFWNYKTQVTPSWQYDIILADDSRYCYYSIQLSNPGSFPYSGMRIANNSPYRMYGQTNNNEDINRPKYFAFVNSQKTKSLIMYEDGIEVASTYNSSFHFSYINGWGWNDRSRTPGLIDDFMIVKQDLWTRDFRLPNHYLLDPNYNDIYSIEDSDSKIYGL